MVDDFTLVIPTYNRPHQLKRLLGYLAREKATFPIRVLDSSLSEHKLENRKSCVNSDLNIDYVDFDNAIPPFDKFAQGILSVKTKYCQLCADDDLILVEGIQQCLDFLRSNAEFVVAHGYYFMFYESEEEDGMNIPYTLYHAPSYESNDPLQRLKSLFRNYQALTYGIYATPVLQKIFNKIRTVDKILARELLSSALAVVYGKAARLPFFTHGRNLGASAFYQYWHPLEWLMVDPNSLFSEYNHYANIITDEIAKDPTNNLASSEIRRLVDLIHLFYLFRHAPEIAYDFLLEQMIQGRSLYEVWNDGRVLYPLMGVKYLPEASAEPDPATNPKSSSLSERSFISKIARKILRKIFGIPRRLARYILKGGATKPGSEKISTRVRSYCLHEAFLRPDQSLGIVALDAQNIQKLTLALDNY